MRAAQRGISITCGDGYEEACEMSNVPDIDKMRCPTCGNYIDDTGQCVTVPVDDEPWCAPIPRLWQRAIEHERERVLAEAEAMS